MLTIYLGKHLSTPVYYRLANGMSSNLRHSCGQWSRHVPTIIPSHTQVGMVAQKACNTGNRAAAL